MAYLRSAIIVTPGFSSKTGYYQRALADCAALQQNGYDTVLLELRELLHALVRLRIRTVLAWLKDLRTADVIVSENFGALLMHRLLTPPHRYATQRHVFVAHGSLAELDGFRFGWLKRLLYRWSERTMVPRVHAVFCVSNVMARDFRAAYPTHADRVRWSPNNPHPSFYESLQVVRRLSRDRLRGELGLNPTARILMYVGNMQAWQNLDLLAAVAREGSRQSEHFTLVCLTSAPEAFANALQRAGVPQDRCTVRHVPNSAVPGYLVSADWLFVVRERSDINRVACPTKAVEYLLSGSRLLVSEELGDITELVLELHLGTVVSESLARNPRALVRAILKEKGVNVSGVRELPPEYDRDYTARLFAEALLHAGPDL